MTHRTPSSIEMKTSIPSVGLVAEPEAAVTCASTAWSRRDAIVVRVASREKLRARKESHNAILNLINNSATAGNVRGRGQRGGDGAAGQAPSSPQR